MFSSVVVSFRSLVRSCAFYVVGFGKFSRLFFKLLDTYFEVLYEGALHQFTVNLAALLSL